MKNINLLFALFLIFGFTSCSDDEAQPPAETNLLVGIWQGQDLDVSGTISTEIAGVPFTTSFVGDVYEMTSTLGFSENPNNVTAQGTYSAQLTTTIQGQPYSENIEDLAFLDSGIWEVSGNQLQVTGASETIDATIEELTNDSLILSNISEEEVTVDGIVYTASINAVMFFEKQ